MQISFVQEKDCPLWMLQLLSYINCSMTLAVVYDFKMRQINLVYCINRIAPEMSLSENKFPRGIKILDNVALVLPTEVDKTCCYSFSNIHENVTDMR